MTISYYDFTFTLKATNAAGNATRTFTITVDPAAVVTPTPPSGPVTTTRSLAFTGFDVQGFGLSGIALLAAGAGLAVLGRRRRRAG